MTVRQKMSEAELEVMGAVWRCGGTVTSAQVHEELSHTREWKLNTVITFLNRLEDKGLIRAEKQGRGRSARYIARVTEAEYRRLETQSFLSEGHHGSVASLMTALCGDGLLDQEALQELRSWFDGLPDEE